MGILINKKYCNFCKDFAILKCSLCNNLFCDKHLYSYVDGNNRSITKNSKLYCKDCYKIKY
jgi:hypothetical protein